ncbi:beta strand repeat-containing protein, partial [Bartonella sp. TS25HLJMH]|uniref:beta strand repeat-containing protein n=1 Tax=Bartonella sp. TS25HLJMH TaxID=3243576 RepID=UPI0035CF67C5
MYKKSLLSYTATIAIILSSIYSNAHAESLEASGEGQTVIGETGKTYEILHAKESGKITGENLTITGNKETNKGPSEGGITPPPESSSLESPAAVTAESKNSMITLTGDKTTIKGTDSAIIVGVEAKDGGTISITGGSINASDFGAIFMNSNSDKNKLENVTISSGDDKTLLGFGAGTENSTVTLKDVIIKQTNNAVSAQGGSTITITGGSFASKEATIVASQNSKVTINDSTITSSDDSGLWAKESGTISMTGGSINASHAGASFLNSNSDKNKLKGVTISSNEDGKQITFGVKVQENSTVTLEDVTVKQAENAILANNSSKVKVTGGSFASKEATIAALKNSDITIEGAQITSSDNSGLMAQNGGSISMNGGSIKASQAGAYFLNSNSDKNKLKDVEISSNEGGTPILFGVKAEKNSKVNLEGVRFSQADSGISADSNSEITISKGEFDSKKVTIHAENGSTITLKDNTKVTSSDNVGLMAEQESTINMTGGEVTGKTGVVGAKNGGHITVENVTLTIDGADPIENNESITSGFGAFSEGKDSLIELTGNDTKIKNSIIGLQTKKEGAISMNGGSINASYVGARFTESKSNKNKLKNVIISSNKENELLVNGINAGKESIVSLENVNVKQAENAIVSDSNSKIEITGGSFDAKLATIAALNGGTIILTDNAQITSSDNSGLYAHDNGVIKMTGGTVAGKIIALSAENSGHITITDGTLKTTDDGIGADADGSKSVIELENTTVSDSAIGLKAENNGAISMTGGSIKASVAGAVFSKSESEENYLDNVIISSSKGGALLGYGIQAEETSKVTLKNVTISDAINAVAAYDNSTIKISGGSFKAEDETIYVADGGTINLDDAAQITSSNSYGLRADGLNSTITMNKGHVKGDRTALSAEGGGHITVTGVTITTEKQLSGLGASVINSNSMIELRGTDIKDTSTGLLAQDGGVIKMKKGTITTSTVGATISNSKSNENKLEDVTISSNGKGNSIIFTGLNAQASNITLENVHITQAFTGVMAMDHSQITISGGSFAGNNVGIRAESGSTITLAENAQITSSNGYVLHATGLDSTITMMTGRITGTEAALAVENGGHIDATNISATAEKNGIKFENPEEDTTSEVNLTNAKLHIKNGTGINVDESTGTVNLGEKSEIRGDVLLVNKDSTKGNNFTFTLNSDDSILEGRAKIINSPKTIFNLQNNTQWIVKTSTKEKDEDGQLLDIAQRSRSDISTLNLDNSSIIFSEPTEEHYHTLHIGSGKPDTQEVYKASGDAKIYFNIAWSDGVASADQKTDRLLIHGDVSGNTTV